MSRRQRLCHLADKIPGKVLGPGLPNLHILVPGGVQLPYQRLGVATSFSRSPVEKLNVQHELDNVHDCKAVGVYSGQRLIGHVPASSVPLQQCIYNLWEKYVITW